MIAYSRQSSGGYFRFLANGQGLPATNTCLIAIAKMP
jgi:hypothetical protein